MKADANPPVKRSFSFYKSDKKTLNDLVVALKREGLGVRTGTVIRALAHLNSATEMFSAAVLLDRDLSAHGGKREPVNFDPPPLTADLPPQDIDKMTAAGIELQARGHPPSHSFIMRALLRSAPPLKVLVPQVRRFLEEYPRRPRTIKPKPHGKA